MATELRGLKRLKKKAKKGFQGHPIATIAYYGPDDKMATKVSVGIIKQEEGEVEFMERFFSETIDARFNESANQKILKILLTHQVRSVVITDRIIGCPHEEGIDYPEGKACSLCPFWEDRDRWTGEKLEE